MPRNFLIVLIKYQNWYYEKSSNYQDVLPKEVHEQLSYWRDQNEATKELEKNAEFRENMEEDEVHEANQAMFRVLHNLDTSPYLKKEYRLPWQCFTTPYLGVDRGVDQEILDILNDPKN